MAKLTPIAFATDLIFHNAVIKRLNLLSLDNQSNLVVVQEPEDLAGELDPTKAYLIDGVIDFTGTGISIEIPSGGLNIQGYGFGVSSLRCSDDNYTLFTGDTAGTVVGSDFEISVTGVNSKVWGNTVNSPFDAIELRSVNYINCTSLGVITGYRQLLEFGTGRIGGSPDLSFAGTWGGARLTTTIALNLEDGTTLFKAGAGLTFSGRFITDINATLNTTGALFDFSSSNILNEESLIIKGAYITRNGIINTSDETIHPNITEDDLKSLWSNNTGIPNTYKYIKAEVSTEVLTTIPLVNEYYPLLGTFIIDKQSHFDMPSNGEFRLLSGNGQYQFKGDLVIAGTANDEIDLRITKSTDGGSTFPFEINYIKRPINNFSGQRDVAFFTVDFTESLKKNDRVRIEVENKTANRNVTAEQGSFFAVVAL